MIKKNIFLIAIILLSYASIANAQLTFTLPGCSDDNAAVCDVQTSCGFDLACSNVKTNCQQCPKNTVTCPDGSISECSNTCSSQLGGLSAACSQCIPSCSTPLKSVVIPFDVYRERDLLISLSQERIGNIPGGTSEVDVLVRNNNNFDVTASIETVGPTNWEIDAPETITITKNTVRKFTVEITSEFSAIKGDYGINILLTYQQGDATRTIFYTVSDNAPPSFEIEETKTAAGGQEVSYSVQITNNDPAGFEPTTFNLDVDVPRRWSYTVVNGNNLRLSPQQSIQTELKVTSDEDAFGNNDITVTLESPNHISVTKTITYDVISCGNNVCEPGEEVSCTQDCASDDFQCSGRCEEETDTGATFSTTVTETYSKLLVCKKEASKSECKNDYNNNRCGPGNNCLCGSEGNGCSLSCADTDGAYYFLVINGEERQSPVYTYSCPDMGLQELIGLRDNLALAVEDYEIRRSTIEENPSNNERPCFEALGIAIQRLNEYITLLDSIIESPSKIAADNARTQLPQLRADVDNLIRSFCEQRVGILIVDSIGQPNIFIGQEANVPVKIKNIGNTDYFGYVSCEFSVGQNKKTFQSTCSTFTKDSEQNVQATFTPDISGTWNAKCGIYATISGTCTGAVKHGELTQALTVSTKDIFVESVSATCSGNVVTCEVLASTNANCAGCKIDGQGCFLQSRNGNKAIFTCQTGPGTHNTEGYVFPTPDCNPISPTQVVKQVTC